jgi:DNA primase
MLFDAGLMKPPEDGRPAADMFFGRVMFPIRDRRGRTISFGGRILGDGQPKYVNGPETALFSKRRTLFGLDFAREAARVPDTTVLAVEGYMDVIALHQAGVAGAVAPLGTALTEEQLEELWRLSPYPVLCFDGDPPGARAAARAAELALPLLTAERSLKLATLPAGEDPDTLVRHHGKAAIQAVLIAARPLHEALFDLLREAVGDRTPELRATFSKQLDAIAARIRDRSLAWEYRDAFRARFRELYRRPARSPRGGPAPAARVRVPARPALAPANATAEQAGNLVAILLNHPALLADVEEAFGSLELPGPLARLRAAMLDWSECAELLDSAGLMSHLTAIGLAAEATQVVAASSTECAAPSTMPAQAEEVWWHFFGLMHRGRLDEEVVQAVHDFMRRPDDTAAQRRVMSLRAAQEALNRGEQEMEAEP